MALTRHFKETVVKRAQMDAGFRAALLEESINEFLTGDLDISKSLLRDYVNATMSFDKLAKRTHISNKSLQRMLGPTGNPTTNNFCAVLKAIQKMENVSFEAKIQH